MLGTCIKYCTNASPLGADGTYGWRPNITGSSPTSANGIAGRRSSTDTNGALTVGPQYAGTHYDGSNAAGYYVVVSMNAYNSNSIYTDNGHVYPASVALNFIIKA